MPDPDYDFDETQLPNGFSRADGKEGRPGTETPAETVKDTGSTFEEYPDSPIIERAEQATITHRFWTSWNDALTRISSMGRGTTMRDEFGNLSIILSSKITHAKPDKAELAVVAEGRFFDPPPDEFSCTPVELGVNIIKFPRYFYAFFGDGYGSTTELQNQMVIRLLQDYFENTSANYRDAIIKLLKASLGSNAGSGAAQPPTWDRAGETYDTGAKVSGTDMAKRAALEIIQKYWRGLETPYIVGFEMVWKAWYFLPMEMHPGGVVEDPIYDSNPQLPVEFISTTDPPDLDFNIFSFLPIWNPQCYSDNGKPDGNASISWLRKADRLDKQRYIWGVTRTWWGSPIGYWDPQIYSRDNRPEVPDDYLTINGG